jgi:AraC-like DNA-binding protein
MNLAAYGRRLASSFSMEDPPTLVSRFDDTMHLAVTELWHLEPGFGFTAPITPEPAYLVGLQLMDVQRHGLWFDGRAVPVKPITAGTMHFYDLRQKPVAWLPEAFHPLFFYVPMDALARLAESLQMPAVSELQYHSGEFLDDPVIHHLGLSLLPALRAGQQNQQLFVDQILLALRTHLLTRYGGSPRTLPAPCGGLAPWQQHAATELMREHLSDGIALEVVAQACGLSTSVFIRLFHASFGQSPHQWLIQQRIAMAIELMHDPMLGLADIACSAGFADQSHFTRSFTHKIGIPPGAWRASLGILGKPSRH